MAPQSAETIEAYKNLKAKLAREKSAPSNTPIASATNRGHKLRKGAQYVHSGTLPYRHGSSSQKEKVNHAGFDRYIVSRNPKRFTEYGDELGADESDEGVDAGTEDENPYGQVRIEEILRPLTHPTDLANHATFSHSYLDPALLNMAEETAATLRRERLNLWNAKRLLKYFVGDSDWMPAGAIETEGDWKLLGPFPEDFAAEPSEPLSRSSSGRKRKRNDDVEMGGQDQPDDLVQNGIEPHDHASGNTNSVAEEQAEFKERSPDAQIQSHSQQGPDTKAEEEEKDDVESKNVEMEDGEELKPNGDQSLQSAEEAEGQIRQDESMDTKTETEAQVDTKNEVENDDENNELKDSPAPPPRRITRALAATNISTTTSPPLSPTISDLSTDDSLLEPHPLYLLPSHLQTTPAGRNPFLPDFLPAEEAIETRKLLSVYIQKSEETIRGTEALYAKLIKAKRMRERVLESCIREGHVGDMSDGEDWIDTQAWGIEGELKKGKDEEDTIAAEEEAAAAAGTRGKKGRRRRDKE